MWHVMGKYFAEGVGNIAGNKAPDGGGDANRAKFWFVKGIFVEAEEVDVGEVSSDWRGEVILVYLLEDEVEIFGCGWILGLDEIDKYIDWVGIHPGTFVAAGVEDSGADVPREGIGLGGWWQWGVSLGRDWLCVELFDNVDVGVINGDNQVRGDCSCDSSAELVGVCCFLGGTVVANRCRGIVLWVLHAGHGYVVDIFDVTRRDGVDAIADGFMDRLMGVLGSGGGR
jgi:hypothetical protein